MALKRLLPTFLSLTSALLTKAAPSSCVGTIDSLDDVANAVKCTSVTLNGFTVPAGKGLTLSLLDGTTVDMKGDISFGTKSWAGPLFVVTGKSITFNGNGHKFDGGGPFYWDGLGGNGVLKPSPMMHIKMSGDFSDVGVINSPAAAYAVYNPAPLVMSNLNIDNSQGDEPNSKSKGKAAGHNTDGFYTGKNDLTIQDSVIHNQDDCLAIKRGSNIVFRRNKCINGHGISIGSIVSDAIVSGVKITDNTITNSDQALRIKTQSSATGGTVSDITYSGNTATGIRRFGVIIDQSYPSTLKTPGNGVTISGVSFISPTNTLEVNSGAKRVAVNCGKGSCKGTWDWSYLQVSGGTTGPVNNFSGIDGFSQ